MPRTKRKDKSRVVLRTGESQRADGTYHFSWTDANHKRRYATDKNGQFTSKEYICDSDWTVREITPSEGYLLDTTVHKVGAEPQLYTVEHIIEEIEADK